MIDEYVRALTAGLPASPRSRSAIRAEVRDGLETAAQAHAAHGLEPEQAARAAIAEFGDPRVIALAFASELAAARARRVGVGLVATGPLVGAAWLAALGATPAALLRGRLPGVWAAGPLLLVALLVAIPAALIAIAAAERAWSWVPDSPRVAPTGAAVASAACLLADAMLLAMLAIWVATSAGTPGSLGLLAAVASTVRLTVNACAVRRCLAARAAVLMS